MFYCKFCAEISLNHLNLGKIIVNVNNFCLINDCVFSELWPILCLPSQNDAGFGKPVFALIKQIKLIVNVGLWMCVI